MAVNDKHPYYDDPIFEAGRQDVLNDLKNTYERRLKWLKDIKDKTDNLKHSIEFRNGTIDGYEQILSSINGLKSWNEDKGKIAATNPSNNNPTK